MFERAPFRKCPACSSADGLGVLSVGVASLTRRCRRCRHSVREALPPVEKAVVYLDQFAISNVYKVSTGTLRPTAPSRSFWIRLHEAVQRAYLLQQVVFPASNIHDDETLVATEMADGLSLAHDMLSGDTEFHRVEDIVMAQVWAFAEAYADGKPPPVLDFNVDDILNGDRNAWIPELHISANMSFRQFAPAIKAGRDSAAAEFEELAAHWAREKPSFATVLKRELNSMESANRRAVLASALRAQKAVENEDWLEMLEGADSAIMRQFQQLRAFFEKRGVAQEESTEEVLKFWRWPGNHHQPEHRISSYLFAGLARRIVNNQRAPDRGILNDIRAIATYGPYVDAMFIDRMFDNLLREQPLARDLTMKAQFFSMRAGDAFITYLDDLAAQATDEVRRYAHEAYGVT
jgi:hypothetical protein